MPHGWARFTVLGWSRLLRWPALPAAASKSARWPALPALPGALLLPCVPRRHLLERRLLHQLCADSWLARRRLAFTFGRLRTSVATVAVSLPCAAGQEGWEPSPAGRVHRGPSRARPHMPAPTQLAPHPTFFTIFCSSTRKARTMRSLTTPAARWPPYARCTVFLLLFTRCREEGRTAGSCGQRAAARTVVVGHAGQQSRAAAAWQMEVLAQPRRLPREAVVCSSLVPRSL